MSAVDEDGNEVSGVRMPEVAVPLATYTGWNLFNAESGPPDEISSMVGSFLPFPRTPEEARAAGDPRTAISERYSSREDYLGQFTEAALDLIEAGYLLGEDLPALTPPRPPALGPRDGRLRSDGLAALNRHGVGNHVIRGSIRRVKPASARRLLPALVVLGLGGWLPRVRRR